MHPDVSLDNVTLVGRWLDWGEVCELVEQWAWEDGDCSACRILPAHNYGTADYQRCAVVDGAHVSNWCCESEFFFDVEKSSKREHPGRIEFNPNKLTDRIQWLIRVFEPDHASRVDVAIDYDVAIGGFVWRRDRVKSQIWVGAGGVESLYLGSRCSDRFVRIYDKALELKVEGRELTRVEGMGRKHHALNPGLFEGVSGFVPDLAGCCDARDGGLVALYLHYPEYLRARCDERTCRRAKELARETQAVIEPSPHEVYMDCRPELVEMLAAVSEGEAIRKARIYEEEEHDVQA